MAKLLHVRRERIVALVRHPSGAATSHPVHADHAEMVLQVGGEIVEAHRRVGDAAHADHRLARRVTALLRIQSNYRFAVAGNRHLRLHGQRGVAAGENQT